MEHHADGIIKLFRPRDALRMTRGVTEPYSRTCAETRWDV
jgi:hypothetical protein